jgi:hypothetical protein
MKRVPNSGRSILELVRMENNHVITDDHPRMEKGKEYKLKTPFGVRVVKAIGPEKGGRTWLVREGDAVMHARLEDLMPIDDAE